jgi:hypothetical protein
VKLLQAAHFTLPRKRRPHGKPPSAGTTSMQLSGLPKFERSEQRQLWVESDSRAPAVIYCASGRSLLHAATPNRAACRMVGVDVGR